MSKDLIIKNNVALPAHLRGLVPINAIDEFAGGVKSGFPIVSIRGRVWRIKSGGEEHIHTDENDDAVASVELVLLRSNSKLSKIFYEKNYEEGDDGKPRCFSPDGEVPSPEVQNPIHSNCQSCPNNQWGSRITESGKKSRACSDNRRAVVVFAADLQKSIDDPNHKVSPMLLRVPPASLGPLKDYATKTLAPKGVQPYMLVTRCGFDNTSEYPKLTFKPSRFLSEEEFAKVMELRESDEASTILQSVIEYSTPAGTTEDDESADSGSSPSAAEVNPAPAGSSKKAAGKRTATAAEAEEAASNVASVFPDEDDEDEIPPAPVVKAKAAPKAEKPKAAKPKPAPVVEADDEDDDVPTGGNDFSSMLDSILADD